MTKVAISTENVVIPYPGAGMLIKVEWLEKPPEYFVQHLPISSQLLTQQLLRNNPVQHWNWYESYHSDAVG